MSSSGGWGFGRLFQYDPAELEGELMKRGAVIVDVTPETQIVLRKLGGEGGETEAPYLGEIHHGDLEPVSVRAATLSEIMMRVVGELAKMEHGSTVGTASTEARDDARAFVDGAGRSYRAQLAPVEHSGGVEPDVLALVFTRESDGSVRSVRVPAHLALDALTESELIELHARSD